MSAWTDHVASWKDCTECPLCQQRDRIVLARGQVPADVVFVGEAPGASEDAMGIPFCGPAGQLLDQIVERALSPEVRRAFTNLVACFPREAKMAGDNEPERGEIMSCRPRLAEFVLLCKPKLVVTVGRLATEYMHSGTLYPHGQDIQFCSIDHPAYILRMPLVQRQMATQKAIVVVRTAVAAMLEPTNEGTDHAGKPKMGG